MPTFYQNTTPKTSPLTWGFFCCLEGSPCKVAFLFGQNWWWIVVNHQFVSSVLKLMQIDQYLWYNVSMNTDTKPRRTSINFSPETEKILRERSKENKRSLTQEVVWIVEQFLKKEVHS